MTVLVSPEYADTIMPALNAAWNSQMGGGSDKQITWARNLRNEYLSRTLGDAYLYFGRRHADEMTWRGQIATAIVARISKAANAQFWIQNRDALSLTQMGQDVQAIVSAKGLTP